MPSQSWKALGGPLVLGHLRPDLARSQSVLLIGPWIDDYFADAILGAAPNTTRFRVVSRPYEAMGGDFVPHARAAHDALLAGGRSEVRVLRTLHAKLIIIDEQVAYCGSANWYRYSLETSQEVVLRGPAADASGLLDEAEKLWQKAIPLTGAAMSAPHPAPKAKASLSGGYKEEAVDPIAAEVLRAVPGSFVLKRTKPSKS